MNKIELQRHIPKLCSMIALLALSIVDARADAAGDALFQKCMDAESKLKSLQADFTIIRKQGGASSKIQGSLKLIKPNRARVVFTGSQPSDNVTITSDGKKFYTYFDADNEFRAEGVDAQGGNLANRICLEAEVFFNSDILDRFKSQGSGVKITETATVGGVTCKALKVTGLKGDASGVIYIGPDNLLRGIDSAFGSGEERQAQESRLANVKTGSIPAADFAWNLPKGAKPFMERAAKGSPTSGTSSADSELLTIGAKAPEFQLSLVGGGRITLSAFFKSHRVTILDFWVESSGPCVEALPRLEKMLNEFKAKGLGMIAIDSGDSVTKVAKVWKDNSLLMPGGINGDKMAEKYKVSSVPTNYLIDSNGKVIARFEGYDEVAIRNALAKAGVK